jgi:1,4-dihydroxy-2-naphthoate octaprenyltransferase
MSEAGVIPSTNGAGSSVIAIWIRAIRAPSLTAAAMPVLLGGAIAARAGYFSFFRLLLALLGSLAIQAGTNLINDYYDHVKGSDSADSLGPSLVIQQGLLSAGEVWWGGIAAFGIGAVFGLLLVKLCGWPILLIGIPSIAAGYFYTAAPLSLAYAGLGELTVFIFMGPVIVLGAYYVSAMSFSWTALIASVPVGFLVAGILHANNIRDIDSDRLHGKRTLATILGRVGANYELAALDLAAYAAVIVAVGFRALPWTVLFTFITARRALDQLRIVFKSTEPKRLNLALFRSVQLHMEFGLLMILAFLIALPFAW